MTPRAAALLALLVAPAAAVQDKAPRPGFEHVVPSDSVLYVGATDIEQLGRDFRESPGGRFWHDPANAPLREAIEARIDGLTAQMHAELGVDPMDFLGMLHGRVAIASVGLPRVEDLDGTPRGFALALLADVGEDRDACEELLSALADRLAESMGAVRKSTVAGDTAVSVLELTHGDDRPRLRLKHGFHDDTLVLTLELHPMQPDAMETLIARLEGQPGESLADVPRFRSTLAAETGGTQMWMDFGRVLGLWQAWLERQGEEEAETLGIARRVGLFDLGCLSACSAYEKGGSRMRLRLDWSGNGWLQTFARLACVSGPATTLSAVPADCVSAIAARIDFAGMFDAVIKVIIEMQAATMSEVVEVLTEAEEMLGFDVRDDLLDSLDGQVTLVTCEVPAEDALPGLVAQSQNLVLLVGLKDSARVRELVEGALKRTGLHAVRKRTDFQGFELCSVPLPPMQLQYALLPDMAVLSLSGTLVQDVLRRKAGADLPVLARDEEFLARSARLTRQPGLLEYQDTAANMRALFRMLGTAGDLLERIDHGELGAVVDLLSGLPQVDEALIDRHFHGATVAALSVDEHGLAMEAIAP
jgi:hypothetical protein